LKIRYNFCMVKYLSFHKSSFSLLLYFFNVNGKATMFSAVSMIYMLYNTYVSKNTLSHITTVLKKIGEVKP
jgi:hypothetical protein